MMKRLRDFLRRNVLWVGLGAVAVPLLSLLALQYLSLLKLEKTSAMAEKVWMKNYLMDVSKEVKYYYRSNAEQVLHTPASALTEEKLQKPKYLFGKCDMVGAKLLFVVLFRPGGETQSFFYHPAQQARLAAAPSPEVARAVNVASAPFKLLSEEGSEMQSPALSFDERDPNHRIFLKPITDAERKVVGVSGMILDPDYFQNVYLPQVIHATLPKFFSAEPDNIIVTVYDPANRLVMSTQPVQGQKDETWAGLPYFGDYRIGIRNRHMTPEQWAHWNFNVNLSLSVLLTAVLMGGIILALRAASREMRLSQMKTDFVSNVSHELRTPLSSIRVFGEFLKLGRVKEPEKIREYGEYIETESRRLTQLINNILDFSKIESGRKTYHFERASLADVVCGMLKTFEVQLKQQGFHINFTPPAEPLPATFIDADSIAQAFMNLLDNAVKYSGEAREIDVRLGRAGDFVTVSVTDYGVGIPREEQRKIFEKFYRVSTGLVHDVKGSGLGLSLVSHIVEAHGGRVAVESEPGRGSTFTIHLPIAKGAGGEETQGASETLRDPRLKLGYRS